MHFYFMWMGCYCRAYSTVHGVQNERRKKQTAQTNTRISNAELQMMQQHQNAQTTSKVLNAMKSFCESTQENVLFDNIRRQRQQQQYQLRQRRIEVEKKSKTGRSWKTLQFAFNISQISYECTRCAESDINKNERERKQFNVYSVMHTYRISQAHTIQAKRFLWWRRSRRVFFFHSFLIRCYRACIALTINITKIQWTVISSTAAASHFACRLLIHSR